MYGINLWSRYSHSSIERLRVAYNNTYRVLHNLPRKVHIRETMVNSAISTFQSLLRKNTGNFILRCFQSSNSYLVQTFESDCFLYSHYFAHYSKLHYSDFCQCRPNALVGRLRPVYYNFCIRLNCALCYVSLLFFPSFCMDFESEINNNNNFDLKRHFFTKKLKIFNINACVGNCAIFLLSSNMLNVGQLGTGQLGTGQLGTRTTGH